MRAGMIKFSSILEVKGGFLRQSSGKSKVFSVKVCIVVSVFIKYAVYQVPPVSLTKCFQGLTYYPVILRQPHSGMHQFIQLCNFFTISEDSEAFSFIVLFTVFVP